MINNHSDLLNSEVQSTPRKSNVKSRNPSALSSASDIHKTFNDPKFADDIQQYYQTSEKENVNGEFNLRDDQTYSIVDGLLWEIYDRWQPRKDSVDSDTYTDNSDIFQNRYYLLAQDNKLNKATLQSKSITELRNLLLVTKHHVAEISSRLVQQLRRRDRRLSQCQKSYDVITAILQAASLKRRVDTHLRFSVAPLPGDSGFQQWHDAMKAVARLPGGIPREFRKRLWLTLADNHIKDLKLDWEKTKRFTFNEKSNPDDNKLGVQIVKDLHRTGCSGFCGQDAEHDRAVLKRVLLAYARWNKIVGYCQGFNMLAALILEVVERKEDDALKVMIFLIDHVLPGSYFANNLRALSVDMAVFRDLLRLKLPHLAKHLEQLQDAAGDTGTSYEPPLTNVFTMQWFLTLFSTCLPMDTVLRVWDCVLLEGSEILLRTALAIWAKLSDQIMTVENADAFYGMMGILSHGMLELHLIKPDDLIKTIYSIAPFPFPGLTELRDKYTYNITPLSAAVSASKRGWKGLSAALFSDDEELEDEDLAAVTCFAGIFSHHISNCKDRCDLNLPSYVGNDISALGPGAFSPNPDNNPYSKSSEVERITMDVAILKQQYKKLIQRAKEAQVIIAGARQQASSYHAAVKISAIDSGTVAMNHLFIGKKGMKGKNRQIAPGPLIGMIPATASIGGYKGSIERKHIERGKKIRTTDIEKLYPPPVERKSSGDDSSSDSSESKLSSEKASSRDSRTECKSSSDSSEPCYTPKDRSPQSDDYSEEISNDELTEAKQSLPNLENPEITMKRESISAGYSNSDERKETVKSGNTSLSYNLHNNHLSHSADNLYQKPWEYRRKSLDFSTYEMRKKNLSKSESQTDSFLSLTEISAEKGSSSSSQNYSDQEGKEDGYKLGSNGLKNSKAFNPFPSRPEPKAPKSKVGIQLGLYKSESYAFQKKKVGL